MPYSYHTLTIALADAGIEDPRGEALLLLEKLANASPSALMADRHRLYHSPELDAAVEKRKTRYPLQYILGEWEFCGLPFAVNEHCLVPRPDTEILVEEAIRTLPQNARVVDLCTGSGCIAVATLRYRPDVTVTALELYPHTLALATRNAETNGVADRFTPLCADLLGEGFQCLEENAPYHAILSNPPYIPTEEIRDLSPEVHKEPFAALDGGADGLIFYRDILQRYASLLAPGGCLLLEIGWNQAKDLKHLQESCLPHAALRVLKDLGGNDRVVVITLP